VDSHDRAGCHQQSARGRRLITIVIDELILQEESAVPDVMQRLARTIIDQLGPADLASVTYLYDNNLGQEFAAESAKLDQAVDRLQPVFPIPDSPGPMPLTTSGSYVDVIGALAKLTGTLADVQHRRKIVFFIGTGPGINAGLQERDALYGAAQRADVDFYCLDAAGLQVAGAATVLIELSHNTGGEAVKDTNTPWQAVPAIFRENQSYYLLGFEPDPAIPAGRSRRLEVKVDRPGVQVRTKSRYTTPSPSEVVAEPTVDGPLPVGDLPLQISALPMAAQAKDRRPVVVELTVGEPSVRTDVLQVDVDSYTADDVQEMAGQESVRAVPQAAPGESRQVAVFAPVDLPPDGISFGRPSEARPSSAPAACSRTSRFPISGRPGWRCRVSCSTRIKPRPSVARRRLRTLCLVHRRTEKHLRPRSACGRFSRSIRAAARPRARSRSAPKSRTIATRLFLAGPRPSRPTNLAHSVMPSRCCRCRSIACPLGATCCNSRRRQGSTPPSATSSLP
jgi:VWFA-related protein